MTDREIRNRVKLHLPQEAFIKNPARLWFCLPLIAIIASGVWLAAFVPLPWPFRLGLSLLIGNLYIALMLFAHEVGHGVHGGRAQQRWFVLFVGFLVYLIPPSLWTHWHNAAHHAHSNHPEIDPDNFDAVEAAKRGMAHRIMQSALVKGLSGLLALTMQGQRVFWISSRSPSRQKVFRSMRRGRILIELLVTILFWGLLSFQLGLDGSLWGVVLPMAIANIVIMSYVVTNHLLCPMSTTLNALQTTMSVKTLRILDLLHLNFSHHTEHHLFPEVSHRYYPLVRQVLEREFACEYQAPAHWRALFVLFRVPRAWNGEEFFDQATGRRVALAEVARMLHATPTDSTAV
jgi:fatty acid desaturase